MNRNRMARGFAALAAVAVIVGACTSGGAANTAPTAAASAAPTAAPASAAASEAASAPASAPASAATTQYTIGYSNGGGVGNGFREEQVCTARSPISPSSIATPTPPASSRTSAA